MIVDEVNRYFRTLFRELLDYPENHIRPGNQVAPTGATDEPFGTVTVVSMDNSTWATVKQVDEPAPSTNIEETVIAQMRLSLSVQFYRALAYDTCLKLALMLQSSAGQEKMTKLGVGLITISAVRNLTALVDTQFESRGQFDADFYINAIAMSSIATYGTAQISITTDAPDSFTTSFEVTLK